MERVAIFIDGSNFYHELVSANIPPNFDFHKLASRLTGAERKHTQTFYYNIPRRIPDKTNPDYDNLLAAYQKQQRFFQALRFVPSLTLKLGHDRIIRIGGNPMVCPSCGCNFSSPKTVEYTEKGVDVMLATDTLPSKSSHPRQQTRTG